MIDIGGWLICGGGQLQRFYCILLYFKWKGAQFMLMRYTGLHLRAKQNTQLHNHLHRNTALLSIFDVYTSE